MKNINSYTQYFCLLVFLILSISFVRAQEIQLQHHLIGQYALDGEVKDASGNNRHGDLYGATLEKDRFGQPNGALALDRKSFIKIPDDFNQIRSEVSLAIWVLSTEDSIQTLISKYHVKGGVGNGFKLLIDDGKAVFVGRDGSPDYRSSGLSSTMVNDSVWHFIVGICNGDSWEIWVDGKKENESTSGYKYTNLNNQLSLQIGNFPQLNEHFFTGSLDDLYIYNRALNESEIKLLYKMGYMTAKEEIEMRVESSLKVWEQRGKYEKTEQYVERVNPSTRLAKREQLMEEAIQKMGKSRIHWQYVTHHYDPDTEQLTLTFEGFQPYTVDMPIEEAPLYDISNFHLLSFENVRFGLTDEGHLEILNLEILPPRGR